MKTTEEYEKELRQRKADYQEKWEFVDGYGGGTAYEVVHRFTVSGGWIYKIEKSVFVHPNSTKIDTGFVFVPAELTKSVGV